MSRSTSSKSWSSKSSSSKSSSSKSSSSSLVRLGHRGRRWEPLRHQSPSLFLRLRPFHAQSAKLLDLGVLPKGGFVPFALAPQAVVQFDLAFHWQTLSWLCLRPRPAVRRRTGDGGDVLGVSSGGHLRPFGSCLATYDQGRPRLAGHGSGVGPGPVCWSAGVAVASWGKMPTTLLPAVTTPSDSLFPAPGSNPGPIPPRSALRRGLRPGPQPRFSAGLARAGRATPPLSQPGPRRPPAGLPLSCWFSLSRQDTEITMLCGPPPYPAPPDAGLEHVPRTAGTARGATYWPS